MIYPRSLFMVLFLAISAFAVAKGSDSLRVRGYFMKDSAKVGEPLRYVLKARRPPSMKVLYPDSLHDFAPFELEERHYGPTRLRQGLAEDSVVFHLRTFSLDAVQGLNLPVYKLQGRDSLPHHAPADSIKLVRVLPPPIPDSAQVRANSRLHPMETAFNYPYWLAGGGAALVVVVGAYLLFGRSLQRQWKLYRLNKRHQKVLAELEAQREQILAEPRPTYHEAFLQKWKRYLSPFVGKPLTSLSTREIDQVFGDGALKNALKKSDRWIYGGKEPTALRDMLDVLTQACHREFENRRNQLLKSGK